ncbi:LTA synthase family protein [Candidatus Avelusimicrobium luingense]|uniref:LTA synthase family protein n=1 Tax=Candidatus Avelusimicrobium luingense TaxID=3416211 RepID=UPI003D0B712C
MAHILKPFLTSFKTQWKLLLIFSIPAVLLGIFGLHQVGRLNVSNAVSLTLIKGVCEFCFIGFCLAVLNLLHIKNKWALSVLGFLYYFAMTADFVLLVYFRERFGAKYLDTVQGGDYNFMTDWRLLTYFALLFLFCAFVFRRFFTATSAKETLRRAAVCLVGFLLLMTWTPLKLLPAPDNFYTTYLLPPSLIYTYQTLRAKTPPVHVNVDERTAALAQKYHVFSAKKTGVGKDYKRVILIASESLSNKYLHHFNPNIPAEASAPLDKLYENYPSASLKHVTLSTLYGLTVIFTSHPFVRVVVENDYPVSFVRMLKERGFHTAFLRGANETYMSENILFQKAGFEKVIGATYFQTRQDYAPYVNWWGLLDRKLFDYALEYLGEHKNEPTFITVLTVDSHVPLGRLDYLDEKYTEIDHKDYKTPTLPRAFARFGQDVERFLDGLKKRGLFDDKTLVLIMPDHPSYSNMPTVDLFTPFQPEYDNLPFMIVTKNKISAPITTNPLASQLDIAPTVLDLLNIEPPQAFFGHSLFDTKAKRSVFDIKEDYAVITTDNEKRVMPLNTTRSDEKELLNLMTTIVRD